MINLEQYLADLYRFRNVVTKETGNYPYLKKLLDDAGALLTPKVLAASHPDNSGAGIPDLALYDEKQPKDGTKPGRGVIEVKGTSANLDATARSEQVKKYLAHYGQVLVTNLYQFVLVTRGEHGEPQFEERYNLAPDEKAFWTAAQHPRALAAENAAAFTEYLQRVMLRKAPLITPKDVAAMLASYARVARNRLDGHDSDFAALDKIKTQLESALGVRFEDAAALEFFKSTLVQTLFYGVFSAWVLWHQRNPKAGDRFDLWRDTRELRVPVIQEIFHQLTNAATLRPLNIEDVLEWTADALNRVDRAAFFEAFETGDAVQYFYEPFLEAFDPELRKQLGVWYTPREVVRYMVARVDAALRDELGIADGLADESVVVLDPCCGTGAYLVEVLHLINRRLSDRDGSAMAALDVAKAMRERIFGFELLPAPFVIAHLQLGLLLTGLGAPLKDGERAGVYLTNSLTGWEHIHDVPLPNYPALRKEHEIAQNIKQKQRILVIIGNPPYSGYAGVAIDEERVLVDPYRTTKRAPKPQGRGLNDLYVRFFGMAERKITGDTGRGIVSYISNYSWLDGLSHTGMREHFLDSFDSITVDNLNGDKFRTGKTTPEGLPDPSIFSTPYNREGIQLGTAVVTLVCRGQPSSATTIRYRDLWGVDKRLQLVAEVDNKTNIPSYENVTPSLKLGYPFTLHQSDTTYLTWPTLPMLFPRYFPGVITSRDRGLVDLDEQTLRERINSYLDKTVSNDQVAATSPDLMRDTTISNAQSTRRSLLENQKKGEFIRYAYRPFDWRWLYWEDSSQLLTSPRADFKQQMKNNNVFLVIQQKPRGDWTLPQITGALACFDLIDRGSSSFPLQVYPSSKQRELWDEGTSQTEPQFNLSELANHYLSVHSAAPEILFYHAIAVLHAFGYRQENAGALRQDWPRVPLPADRNALLASAELGRRVAALLDPEHAVKGVTIGDLLPELYGLAALSVTSGMIDLEMRVNWGYFGQQNAVMPGKGRITTNDDGTLNIWLNPTTYWANVPQDVWDYTLGGYQVLKKWLSYRESKVLGRPIRQEEAREFTHIARRIAALLALSDELDASYARCKAAAPST